MYNESVTYKFQITLPADLAAEMKNEAARLGLSLAELIRQTMRDRMAKRRERPGTHPFASIAGIVDDAEPDLAARVDELLYQ